MDDKDLQEAHQEFAHQVISEKYFQNRDKSIKLAEDDSLSKSVVLLTARSLIYRRDKNQNNEVEQHRKIEKWFSDISKSKYGDRLLDAAAQCDDLIVVFDFDYASVDHVDMRGTGSLGTTYTTYHWIFIGAKSTADSNRDQEIKGVLAHEICHYVMKMIYENKDSPYLKGDNDRKTKYEEIVTKYNIWKDNNNDDHCDGIISSMYRNYPKEDHHAELIVRPVNIYAHYDNNPEKIVELEKMYDSLFHYYINFVIPDMQKLNFKQREMVRQLNQDCDAFCDEIRTEIEDSKVKKLMNHKDFDGIVKIENKSDVYEIGGDADFKSNINDDNLQINSILDVNSFDNETKHVNIDNKRQSDDLIVTTVNVPQLFIIDLYRHLYELYGNLLDVKNILITPTDLKNKQISMDFERIINQVPNVTIFIDCTKELQSSYEFLNIVNFSKFVFIVTPQKHSTLELQLSKLNIIPRFLEYAYHLSDLTPEYQTQLLQSKIYFQNNPNSSISQLFTSNNSIQVDIENFVDENLLNLLVENLEINININNRINRKDDIQHFNILFSRRNLIKIQKNSEVFKQINQDQLLLDVKNQKFVLISDKAGSGKSWMLRNISNVLKERYPSNWVEFIDLKQFVNDFVTGKTENFEDFMIKFIIKPKNNYEASIFKKLYSIGKVFILIDGFDEIAPNYAEFVLNLAKSFEFNGGNQLWITTRTFFEVNLQSSLGLDVTYKLDPFTEQDGIDLIATSLVLNESKLEAITSIEDIKRSKNFDRNYKIAQNLSRKILALEVRSIGFPLFFRMIIEILATEKQAIFKLAILKIYSKFIKIQYNRWSRDKGEIRKAANVESSNKVIDYMDVHHFFAMRSLFPNKSSYCGLKVEKCDWIEEEIIASGMLYKNGDNFLFLHETFREYCAADFIVKNLKKKRINEELCEYLNKFITVRKFGIVRMFLNEAFADDKVKKKIELKLPEISAIFYENIEYLVNLTDIFDEQLESLVDFLVEIFKNGSNEEFEQVIRKNQQILASITKNDEIFKKFQSYLVIISNSEQLMNIVENFRIIEKVMISNLNSETCKYFMASVIQKTNFKFIKNQLVMTNADRSNIISKIFQLSSLNFDKFNNLINILQIYITNEELISIMRNCNAENWNILHFCADTKSQDKSSILLKIVEIFLTSQNFMENFNNLLQDKTSDSKFNALMLSANCPQINFQSTFWTVLLNCYENLEDLKNLILESDLNDNNYIHNLITHNQPEVIELIFNIFKENFTECQYKELINSKGFNSRNILQSAAEFSKNKNVHQLLWNIIQNSCKSNEEFLSILNEVDIQGNNIFHITASHSTGEIFKFMIQEYENLQKFEKSNEIELKYKIRKIFNKVDKSNRNLLQLAAFHNKSFHIHVVLWQIIEKSYNSHEVLIFCKNFDINGKNLVQIMIEYNGKDVIESLWERIFENIKLINFSDRELLLNVKKCDGIVNKALQGRTLSSEEKNLLKLDFLKDEKLDLTEVFPQFNKDLEVKIQISNLSDLFSFTGNKNFLDHEALWISLQESFKTQEKFNDLMLEKDKSNNNYIHLLVGKNSASVIEMTLKKLQECISKDNYEAILESKGYFDRNLLQRAAALSKDIKIHNTIWNALLSSLKIDNIINMLAESNAKTSSFFHILVFNSTNEILEFYINQLEIITDESKVKELLLKLNSSGRTLLQTATFGNKSLTLHQSLWNIFEKHFSLLEFLEICAKNDHYGKNLITTAVEKNTTEIVEYLWCKITEIINFLCINQEFIDTSNSTELTLQNSTKLEECSKIIQKFAIFGKISLSDKELLKLNWIKLEQTKLFTNSHNFQDNPVKSYKDLLKFITDNMIENHQNLWDHLLESFPDREELVNILSQKDSNGNNYLHLMVTKCGKDVLTLTFDKLKFCLDEAQFNKILKSKGYFNRNLLQKAASLIRDIEIHKILWKIFQDSSKSDKEFLEIITESDKNGNNVFILAAFFSTDEIFEFMVQKLQEKFSAKEIRQVLTSLTKYNKNVLQMAASSNKSLNLHQSVWKVIETYFDPPEILQFIKHFDVYKNNLLLTTIDKNVKDVIEFTWKQIRKIINQCNYIEGDSIKNMRQCDDIVSKAYKFGCIRRNCYEILELKWIVDKNLSHSKIFVDQCEIYLGNKMSIKTLDDFLLFISNKNIKIHQKLWSYLLSSYQNREELKNLLIQKNKNKDDFLHLLIRRNTANVIDLTINKMRENLTETQFQEIIKSKGTQNRNVLMASAFNNGDIKIFEILWKAVHSVCESDDKFFTYLEEVEILDNNVFHIAAIFSSADVFDFMIKELEKIATKEKIKHLLRLLNLFKRNLLQSAARRNKNVELHRKMWEIHEKYFDGPQLLEIITYIDEDFETILSTAIKSNQKPVIKIIWNRIMDCLINLDIEDPAINNLKREYNELILNLPDDPIETGIKKNLLQKWNELEVKLRNYNATKLFDRILFFNKPLDDFEIFFRTTACDNGEYHERIWIWLLTLIEDRSVIKNSILKMSNIGENFLTCVLRYSTPEVVRYLISLWKMNFEKEDFQEILIEKAVFNTNLLQKIAYCTKNIEIHKFVWKLFRESCNSDAEFLKIIADEDKFVFNVIMVVAMFNSAEVLNFMIDELEKIATREEIRRLLCSLTCDSTYKRNFLLSAVNRNKSLELHQAAWIILKKYFSKSEIIHIVNFYDEKSQLKSCNLLSNAIFWNTKEVAEITWEEIKIYILEKQNQVEYLKKNVGLSILELALDNEFDSEMLPWVEQLVCEYNISFNG